MVQEQLKPQSYDVKNAHILHMCSKNIPLYMTSHIVLFDVHVKRELQKINRPTWSPEHNKTLEKIHVSIKQKDPCKYQTRRPWATSLT